MRPSSAMIASVLLALHVGWALPGCGGAGNDAGTASTAGAAGVSTGGSQGSAGSVSGGASAGGTELTGGASSGAGGTAGAGGTGGMCIMPGGDLKSCVLDQQNKRDAATACTPGAPDQCQDRITNDCGCQVAVNDADSPQVTCYLATLAERPCSVCTPEPCAQPLGECKVADRPTPTCR